MNVSQVSRTEFDQLQASQRETHKMVSEMHSALMTPQPGHGDKSLVERMAEVTIRIETGDRVVLATMRVAKFVSAVGVIVAALSAAWAVLRFGAPHR